jgi:hypothetical protein
VWVRALLGLSALQAHYNLAGRGQQWLAAFDTAPRIFARPTEFVDRWGEDWEAA